MWWDPSISLDLNFLSLAPYLDESSLEEYPIDGKKLRNIINEAVSSFHIDAAIGATHIYFLKNSIAHLRKDFEFMPISFIDRLFYLAGERAMSNKTQNSVLKFTRLVVRKWLENIPS